MKQKGFLLPWGIPLVCGIALGLALPASLFAQNPGGFNEKIVKPQVNVQDKSGIYVLEFHFKEPRLISVDIPGRGRRVVWYLWYQVINSTGEPRLFIPDFELVTLDKPAVYADQVLPKALEAIRRIEDPTNHYDIKNSVTISNEPIPPSKPDAVPRAVTGVAMWDDVNPDSNRYSIFVTGLSNGLTVDDREVQRRKTLQLNFKRLGDRYNMASQEIHFISPYEWIYRAISIPPETLAPLLQNPPKVREKEEGATSSRTTGGLIPLRKLIQKEGSDGPSNSTTTSSR